MRRKRKFTREIQPDSRFSNVQVAKFINHVMRKGKSPRQSVRFTRPWTSLKKNTVKIR